MTLSKVKCPPTIGDHLEEMIIPIPTIFQRCKPEVSFQIDGFIAITDGTQSSNWYILPKDGSNRSR